MSFADKLKGALGQAKGQVSKNSDKITGGIDKAAAFADKRTKGKYSDKITKGTTKAKESLAKLDDGQNGPGNQRRDHQPPVSTPTPDAQRPTSSEVGRFVVVPAAYVFCLRPGPAEVPEVLLQLRRGTGYMDEHWAAGAAGHIEKGETAPQAACREAAEELGIDVEPAFLTTMQRRRPGPAPVEPIDERVDFFFVVTDWVGEPAIQENAKCADLRWFALDALPTPLVPHEALALDEVRRVVGASGRLERNPTPYLTFGF